MPRDCTMPASALSCVHYSHLTFTAVTNAAVCAVCCCCMLAGLWLFSRKPIDPTNTAIMRDQAKKLGFDLSVLKKVKQEGCTYPSTNPGSNSGTSGNSGSNSAGGSKGQSGRKLI